MAELRRTLGFWLTSAFVFLNLVNTGIFFGVPLALGVAGVDSLVAWVLLACMSVYTGMCFAELTTMFPRAGGVYEFAKQAYGSFVSFEVGWAVWTINNIATALLVVAAMEYLLPLNIVTIFGMDFSGTVVKTVLAVLAILLLNAIAYRGADESAKLMLVLAAFTFALMILVIVPGVLAVQTSAFVGFTWHWPAIILAAFLLSETFFGWESISFMAEEIKDPSRTIPKALISTTAIVAVMSVLVAIAAISVLGEMDVATLSKPLISVLERLHLAPWLLLVANLGVVVTFLGNAAGGIIGNPRLLMALSRDKLFIEQFEDIHERYQTPYRGVILQTVAAVLIVFLASGGYQKLLELLIAPSILLYAAILFLVPYFRWKRPDQERPYAAPLGKILPLLLVAGYLCLLVVWTLYDPGAVSQLRLLGSFLILSIPVYLLLVYFYNPDVLVRTLNNVAILNLWLENWIVPRRVRREILGFLPDARNMHVIELGAGVGSLTQHLARHVGTGGKITALDLSAHNVSILERRMRRLGHQHVRVLHDPHLVSRVHPDIERADAVVSVANLSYIQNPAKILRELYALLPYHGRVCFVEYIDFFWFLPNSPKWLSRPDEIRKLFGGAGFSVNVRVRNGLLWKYLYIYGVKDKRDVPYI